MSKKYGRGRLVIAATAAAALVVTGLVDRAVPSPAATRPAVPLGTVGYGYDADGRLTSVTDTTGATRSLSYDAVGNLIGTAASVVRTVANTAQTSPKPVIDSVAAAGSQVTVSGRDLPAADVAKVKVGGLFATVRSATPGTLVADLPPGLAAGTSQPVEVESDGGQAEKAVTLPGSKAATVAPDEELPDLRAPVGVTAVAGRVRDSRTGAGLKDVLLSVDDRSTRTRADGRFLLTNLESGHHELQINASRPAQGGDHGRYEVGVDAVSGVTVKMAWTTWLTKVDKSHAVRLPADPKHELVVTSPSLPGLEVHVPAGTRLTDDDGNRITELSITRMPIDRQPFPGAPGMTLAWTIQPGNATVSGAGLQVVYPNLAHQLPGTGIDYVDHDADRLGQGWAVYGHGRVSADGSQIVPDPDTRLHETYQLGVSYNPLCKYLGIFCPRPGDKPSAGDPVNLQTGLFTFSRSDLGLPDVISIALTRTYRQNDYVIRSFGMGQSDAFNSFVSPDGAGNYQVQLPDGTSVPFAPTGSGTVYKAIDTPSALTGSVMNTDNHQNFAVTLADGSKMVFGGETASLVSTQDRYGNATNLTRDGSGRVTRVTSPNGRWISLTWGSCTGNALCITAATDNIGRKVSYSYDSSGRLLSVTDVAGKKTNYAWASCLDPVTCTELTSITDPLGNAFVRNTFTPEGRVATQLQPDGTYFSFAYTVAADGHVSSTLVTDPRGNQQQTNFDADGYSSSAVSGYGTALAQTASVTRDAAHRVTSAVDQLGRRTDATYDAVGDPLTQTQLAGTANATTETMTYEPTLHRLASVKNPLGNTGNFSYDDVNQTFTATDPLGHSQTVQLDEGQPVSVTDTAGNASTVSYLDGLPVTQTDPLGRASHSYYDAAGRLTKTTDPLGNRTTYTYDVMGEPLTATDPLGNVSKVSYDADGDVLTRTDPLGHVSAFGYDSFGRLSTSKDALGASAVYGYDANSNLTSYQSRAGVKTVYTYDALDRATFVGYGQSGSTYQSTVTNTFDAGNRLTKSVDTAGGTLTQSFDDLNRLTGQTTSQGSVSYTYDTAGRRSTMTVAGQPVTNYSYDNGNHLTGISSGLGSVTLGYDSDDRLNSVTLPSGVKRSTSYDVAGQLTGLTFTLGASTLGNLSYGYDAAGRRTSVGGSYARTTLPALVSGSSTYNADNALTARGGSTFTYNADGQLTSDGTQTYSWDARGQLTALSGGAAAATFGYDPFGRRATRTVGATTTGFVYDGPNIVQEKNGAAVSANLLTGFGADQTFARSDAAGTRSLLTDVLGSTIGLADSTGTVSTSYSYDPFGVASSTGTASSNPLQFTGRENDGTGLDYYRARYYSPAQERFISQDPLGSAGSGDNLYAYAADSPTNFTDPSGEQLLPGCLIGAALGAGGGALGAWLNGKKYTFWDGARDAAGGCALGALGAWAAEAVGPLLGAGLEEGAAAEGAATDAAASAAEDAAGSAGQDAAESCANSFTGDTPITMADGRTEPIRDVRVGDRVLATDPGTGQTSKQNVSSLIRHSGSHQMERIELSDGSTLDSTGGHLIWDESTGRFTPASELRIGDRVEALGERLLTVTSLTPHAADLTAYNLEIANVHTYYAGRTPILVHNSCGPPDFRPNTDHIFRDAEGHLLQDTAANRELIQSAVDPSNLRSTITTNDGGTLAKYFKVLPDGTQVWAEVRNGVQITNGGLNAIPR